MVHFRFRVNIQQNKYDIKVTLKRLKKPQTKQIMCLTGFTAIKNVRPNIFPSKMTEVRHISNLAKLFLQLWTKIAECPVSGDKNTAH